MRHTFSWVPRSFAAHALLEDCRAQQLLTLPLLPNTDPVFVLVGSVRHSDRPQGVLQSSSSSSTDDDPSIQALSGSAIGSPPASLSVVEAVVVPDLLPPVSAPSASSTTSTSSASYVPAPVPGLSHDAVMCPERSHWPFYGVARGISPFVYETWEECKASTHGVSGALYKGFLRYEDVARFVQSNFKLLKRKPKSSKRVRRFKGFGWSRKGSKASRSQARYSRGVCTPSSVDTDTVPPPPFSSAALSSPSSPSSAFPVETVPATSVSTPVSTTSLSRSVIPRPRSAKAVYCWAKDLRVPSKFFG